jgi:hypothetical protein
MPGALRESGRGDQADEIKRGALEERFQFRIGIDREVGEEQAVGTRIDRDRKSVV